MQCDGRFPQNWINILIFVLELRLKRYIRRERAFDAADSPKVRLCWECLCTLKAETENAGPEQQSLQFLEHERAKETSSEHSWDTTFSGTKRNRNSWAKKTEQKLKARKMRWYLKKKIASESRLRCWVCERMKRTVMGRNEREVSYLYTIISSCDPIATPLLNVWSFLSLFPSHSLSRKNALLAQLRPPPSNPAAAKIIFPVQLSALSRRMVEPRRIHVEPIQKKQELLGINLGLHA